MAIYFVDIVTVFEKAGTMHRNLTGRDFDDEQAKVLVTALVDEINRELHRRDEAVRIAASPQYAEGHEASSTSHKRRRR